MKMNYWRYVTIVVATLSLCIGTARAQEEVQEVESPSYAQGSKSWQKLDGPFFETCSMCHQRLGERLSEQVAEWRGSVHFSSGVFCDSCHGGNPMSTILTVSMGEAYGFKSDPSPEGVPNFCGPSCHESAYSVNEANIHTEDFPDEGWEPNCVTCHGSHEVQEVNMDLVSLEENTCGPCHSRAFYLRQTEKESLVNSHQLIEDLYAQLEMMPEMPIKNTIRVRIDKAYKDLRGLAHYFNRRQIRAEKAPIDTELGYIKGILDFSESAALRQSAP